MKRLALIVNFFSKVPFPKTLTPFNPFLRILLSNNTSGVTTSPSLKYLFKSDKLIVANLLAKFALLNPL